MEAEVYEKSKIYESIYFQIKSHFQAAEKRYQLNAISLFEYLVQLQKSKFSDFLFRCLIII